MSGNIDENNPVYGPGATLQNIDQRRPYYSLGFQAIGTYFTGFNASYDALQVVVNQRVSHGLGFNANYTWGKGTDVVSSDNYNGSRDRRTGCLTRYSTSPARTTPPNSRTLERRPVCCSVDGRQTQSSRFTAERL